MKKIDKLYTAKEVLRQVRVSRNTLFLWFKQHKIPEVRRDRNGHRLFTRKDIQVILAYKNKLIPPRENYFGKG